MRLEIHTGYDLKKIGLIIQEDIEDNKKENLIVYSISHSESVDKDGDIHYSCLILYKEQPKEITD